MNHRLEHLASALQRAVQQVIARGLADPRVSGLISVTEVRLTPDGRKATCRVSVMPHDREALTLKGLEHSATHIRRKAGDLIETRQMPEIAFELDESLKKQAQTLEAIAKIREEREAAGLPSDDDRDAPEKGRAAP